ncbi:MAG: hypothetical protein HYZ29_16025 [Myxococcales bacterium]|nr:hypothetical protein [Myxococcales bacterium]
MKRTIILTPADEALLTVLCEQFPLAPRHRIVQTLIRIGAKVAVADPGKVVAEAGDTHRRNESAAG